MPSTTRTVVAVFDDYATAERAVSDLVNSGFHRDSIQISSSDRLRTDPALGNTGLTGQHPRDTSGGGISGFFRRLFGTDDEYASHYEEAVRRGGAVVSVNTDDEDRAADILDRNGAVDVDERAASWRAEGYSPSRGYGETTSDRSIPVVREELHVGKRDVQKGGVRVYNTVQDHAVEEQVRLREEHVHVERRPVDRQATEADFRVQDDVIEVTEMAEEPVVGKTARVVEEVVVGKDSTERTETVRDTVRRTDVNVERLGSEGSHDYDDDFRRDFQTRYGSRRGATYDTYAPAYQYGYRMASDDRYRGRKWDEVEPALRADYQRSYPQSKWEDMKDSIRYGWDRLTNRR